MVSAGSSAADSVYETGKLATRIYHLYCVPGDILNHVKGLNTHTHTHTHTALL